MEVYNRNQGLWTKLLALKDGDWGSFHRPTKQKLKNVKWAKDQVKYSFIERNFCTIRSA